MIARFIPIYHHSSHHHGHSNVSGGELLVGFTVILSIVALIIYWGVVLMKLSFDDYETKREFYLDLIPFRAWVVHFKEKWADLE